MIEKRPYGEHHQVATRLQNRRREIDEDGLRRGLHDDIGAVEKVFEPEEGRGPGKAGQELTGPAGIAAGRADERQTRHPGRERARDGPTDRAQPEYADATRRVRHARHRSNASSRNQGGGVLSFGAMAGGISAAGAARLRGPLERLYRRYDYHARIGSDAIQYPGRYEDPLDREIVALPSACLAYGRV